MSVKESYLGVVIFLVLAPALLILAPGYPSYIGILVTAFLYFLAIFTKPVRRCVPCGEVVKLGPLGYLKLRFGKLNCPRCGSHIKNSHRV